MVLSKGNVACNYFFVELPVSGAKLNPQAHTVYHVLSHHTTSSDAGDV